MTTDDTTSAPNEQYSDGDFLEAIEAGNQGTGEIADYVGCERRTADYRLRQLRDEGKVTADKIGRTLVWSLSE